MDTDKIERDCADDAELLQYYSKTGRKPRHKLMSAALNRAVRQRRQLIGLVEHLIAHHIGYHCAACGEIVSLPESADPLDSGTGLICSVCGGLTVVDLDAPGRQMTRCQTDKRGVHYDEL